MTIPNSVTSIGENAFCDNYFKNLEDVYCYAEKVPSTKSGAFAGAHPEHATLHVPAASVDLYKAADQWKDFGYIVPLTDETTHISSTAAMSETDKAMKVLQSGRIVILSSGKRYGIDGRAIK